MRRIRRRSGARQQSKGEYQGRNVRVSSQPRNAGNGGERSLSEHDVFHKVAAKPPSYFSLFVRDPGK